MNTSKNSRLWLAMAFASAPALAAEPPSTAEQAAAALSGSTAPYPWEQALQAHDQEQEQDQSQGQTSKPGGIPESGPVQAVPPEPALGRETPRQDPAVLNDTVPLPLEPIDTPTERPAVRFHRIAEDIKARQTAPDHDYLGDILKRLESNPWPTSQNSDSG